MFEEGRQRSRWLLLLLASACNCGDDDPIDAGTDAGDASTDASDAAVDVPPDVIVDGGPTVIVRPSEREPCADPNPLNNPYFGDLHVHTRYSFDAAAYDVRTGPRDAYRFARGEAIDLPPYDADGNATRQMQLSRPLDFAAVTDHAELMAATSICTNPDSEGYDSVTCRSYREGNSSVADFGDFFVSIGLANPTTVRLCRGDPALCADELANVWEDTAQAAEEAYDRTSSCEFTSFIGYEWTGAADGAGRNIHRNILFRTATTLARPVSYVDAVTPDRMWDALEANCLESGTDCDLLAIPHNGNISVGQMFMPVTEEGEPYTREQAERRARLEPLMEIYQHKGSSECVSNVGDPLASEDELCDFEQVFENLCTGPDDPREDCVPLCMGTGSSFIGGGCVAPADFARGALRNGLVEYARTGANPFLMGFIASTDTHATIAGGVEENNWTGHVGNTDDEPAELLEAPGGITVSVRTSSPGGLAVVWAPENNRQALFDSMRRRETYGTSGTRIVARFFGGWSYPADICDRADFVEVGYADGVPMGSMMPARGAGTAPTFAVSALRDPMSAALQHVQIIKGWLDPDTGETSERVFDVAGDRDNGASVDLATCDTSLPGEEAAQLCGHWVDPEFDPTEAAFYYARVLENPTCRWSQRLCNAEGVDCATLPAESPLASCCDGSIPGQIQERAWTSPIWYVPEP